MFKSLGAKVINADELGWRILKHKKIKEKLTNIFGKGIIKNGKIERKKLGEIVFLNSKKLHKLNEVVHPPLLSLLKKEIKNKRGMVVVDAALIFDWGIENWFDYLILVKAEKNKKIERLLKKGERMEKILSKLSIQKKDEELEKYVDIVIENNQSLEELNDKVKKAYQIIKEKLD